MTGTEANKRTRVAVAQMTSTSDVEANLSAVRRCCNEAHSLGAELLVLPECFAYLGPEEGKFAIAETLPKGGAILDFCRDLAKEFSLELVLGGFWESIPDDSKHVYNSELLLGNDGELKAVYRKIHLFDVDLADGTSLRESDTVCSGTESVLADSVAGKLGLSICYDIRFPELYRRLVDDGAQLIAVPAAFTLTTGKDHWHVLLRARAIETQCYMLAAAQFGKHFGNRVSYGHALIVDPWGCVIAECSDGQGVAVATIDLERQNKIRTSLPSLKHRRL
ncbi:MAG: carbon-nitrogen hydrolase family protein [Myxococcales bacterium]|nr:MAG: carbon-nitrogen hydrolase family protein [Myxococcales bacterium]